MQTWDAHVRQQFKGRAALGWDDLAKLFLVEAASERDELEEALVTFQHEFRVEPGVLRPSDSMDIFERYQPAPSWISWLWWRGTFELASGQLRDALTQRRKRLGEPLSSVPTTVGEFVDAWLGRG